MSGKGIQEETTEPEGFSTRIVMAMASDVVENYKSAVRVRQWFEPLAREHGVKVVFD